MIHSDQAPWHSEECSLKSTIKLADADIAYKKLFGNLDATGIPWSQLGVLSRADNVSPATTAGSIFDESADIFKDGSITNKDDNEPSGEGLLYFDGGLFFGEL